MKTSSVIIGREEMSSVRARAKSVRATADLRSRSRAATKSVHATKARPRSGFGVTIKNGRAPACPTIAAAGKKRP
jgi:hypothetical protein